MKLRTRRPESGRRSCSSGSRRRGRCGVFRVIAVVLAAIVGGAVPCSAGGLAIEAPNNLPATPGSSGSFDLLLMNTNLTGGASYEVSSDQFVMSLSGPLGIAFTAVSIATDPVTAPYIFVSSGTTQPGGPPLSADTFPNTTFTGADTEFASPGIRTVNPGDTFGLAHVSYSVSSTTPNGIDSITIAPSPVSLLTMLDGTPISFGFTNGSIAVGTVVPEPWALTQASTAVLIGLGLVWRRRVRQET
ncbi:MAG: hypothetical protein ACLQU5_27605 [Isosphaeraceae bacterium]